MRWTDRSNSYLNIQPLISHTYTYNIGSLKGGRNGTFDIVLFSRGVIPNSKLPSPTSICLKVPGPNPKLLLFQKALRDEDRAMGLACFSGEPRFSTALER